MSLSKEDIKNSYPLPIYNYKVDVEGETIAFSEVSGLSMGYETITYKESKTDGGAGPAVMQMPGQETQPSISLRKGYVKTKNIKVFYDWISSIALNQVEKKNITVSLCDETGAPVVTWTVIDAFPTKLDAPNLDANSSEVAIESMELTALKVTMEEA